MSQERLKRLLPSSPLQWVTLAFFVVVLGYSVHISGQFIVPDYVISYSLVGILFLMPRFHIPVDDTDSLYFETVFILAFLLTYPISSVIWAIVGYGVGIAIRSRRWDRLLMNANNFAVSAIASRAVFHLASPGRGFSVTHILPWGLAAVTYFVVNMLVFSISVVVLERRWSAFAECWASLSSRFLALYVLQIMVGLLLAVVIQQAGLSGVILFTGLVVLVAYSYRDYFRMAKHFKDLSIKDELTGTYNHRWVQSWLDEKIEQEEPFAILMLDIDHFKRYNEAWGHLQGDDALKLVASTVQSELCDGEQVARYIGEKFVVVMPGSGRDAGMEKAEAIRKAIDEKEFPGVEKLPGKRFTVSLGVAAFPEMASTKKELLMMVDDAVYKGKFIGRNRVSIFNSVIDDLKSELDSGSAFRETVNTIKVFLAVLNSKDRYTYAHTERDVRYAEALGRRLGLTGDALLNLRFGAFLHDIGKVEVPLDVLTKSGPLTKDEWIVMKSHVELGVKMIETIPELADCIPIVRHHHERYDGTGYPWNLAGTDIPLEARILTIADSFDAMTTSRPYQRRRGMEEAFEELRLCAGKQFDPTMVEPFIEAVREMGLLISPPDENDEDRFASH